MSTKYKFNDQTRPYFVTLTVVGWIDFFIRPVYSEILFESIQYCQKEKGLKVYAYCLMTSHIHMIIGTDGIMKMEDILRDFKSFTSRKFRKLLEDRDFSESRREWILDMMKATGEKNSNNNNFQFWKQDNHPIELNTNEMLDQRLDYIHNNPVIAEFVDGQEMWLNSSARDYMGYGKGRIEITFID